MMESCKRALRPGILVPGLFLFVQLCAGLCDGGLSAVDIFSNLLLVPPSSNPPDTAGFLDADISYSPFLLEQPRSKDDKFNTFLEYAHGGIALNYAGKRFRTRIGYRHDSYTGAVRIDGSTYGSFSSQTTHRLHSCLWYTDANLQSGVMLGTIMGDLGPHLQYEPSESLPGPAMIQGGLYVKYSIGDLCFSARAQKHPLYLGLTRFHRNDQTDRFRNYPLFLSEMSTGGSVAYNTESFRGELDFSASGVTNNTDLSAPLQMPADVKINAFKIKHTGALEIDSRLLTWNVGGLYGGGWIAGMANSTDGMEYFLADSMKVFGFQARGGVHDSMNHFIDLNGGVVSVNLPSASLNLAPFSQWSILYPQGYRFHDVKLFFTEVGPTVGKTFTFGAARLDCKLGVRYFHTYGGCRWSKRENVQFFTRYVDQGEKSFWNNHGMLFMPEILTPLKVSSALISINIRAVIPWVIESRSRGDEKEQSNENSHGMAQIVGGITAGARIRIPVF